MKLNIPEHVMLKLRTWRDIGNTEVTGFFVTEKNNPLNVIDAVLARATCSVAAVDIKPDAIQDLYIEQTKNKVYPDQLMIWWHTHPGGCANPSSQDTATFNKLGKDRTTNYMYILSRTDEETFRVSIKDKASGMCLETSLQISHTIMPWTNYPDFSELKAEYDAKVIIEAPVVYKYQKPKTGKKTTPSAATDIFFNDYAGYGGVAGFDDFEDETALDVFDSVEEFFEELDDMVVCGHITPEEADMEAQQYGWEEDFYTARKRLKGAMTNFPTNPVNGEKNDITV
jgi:proteasome lid subunit RPN8/RPN11